MKKDTSSSSTAPSKAKEYASPTGFHRHKCDDCGHIWEHKDSCAGNESAHTCICGKEEWYKYFGPEPPASLPKKRKKKSAQKQ